MDTDRPATPEETELDADERAESEARFRDLREISLRAAAIVARGLDAEPYDDDGLPG